MVAITGGGSGIGKETAARFVQEGAKVAINGRNAAKLQAAARAIDPSGDNVIVSAGDISDPATGSTLVEAVVSRFGKLDVLINNAGVFNPKPFGYAGSALEYPNYQRGGGPFVDCSQGDEISEPLGWVQVRSCTFQ